MSLSVTAAPAPAESSVGAPPPPIAARRPSRAATARSVGWLDVLRLVAIFGVVTIHVVSLVTDGIRVPLLSGPWWLGATIDAASRWSVPVFVMISGALLLNPARPEAAGAFYRRRLQRIALPLVAWSAVYFAFRGTVLGERVTTATVVHDVALGHPYLQLYYLFIIAGLYAVTPPLRRLLARCDDRQWALLAAGALGYAVVNVGLTLLAHVGGVNAVSRFPDWLGYYLAGGLLRRVPLPRWSVPAAAVGFVASVAGTVLACAALAARYGWSAPAYYWYSFQTPFVVVMSICVFVLGRALGQRISPRPRRWLPPLAQATFGVFLLHPLLVTPYVYGVGVPRSPLALAVAVPTVVLVVVAATTAATLLLQRVPLLRRLV